jgi:hypothetical protein
VAKFNSPRGYVDADAVAAVAAAVGSGELLTEDGAGGLTGVTFQSEADTAGLAQGTAALSVSGTGDSLTASTDFTTDNIWTASPAGNITITTDLLDGQTGQVRLIHAATKVVTAFSQSGMTFEPSGNSDTLATISGQDGSLEHVYTLTRRDTIIEYTISTR